MTDEQLGQMKLIFNYNDVFYSFFYDDLSGCVHRSREYAINYVYSGEMILDNGNEQIHVGKGECVFIPRDHHITMLSWRDIWTLSGKVENSIHCGSAGYASGLADLYGDRA